MTTPAEIDRAAQILRQGGLVAFPTETVYGLGASALDVRALARVFEVKGRPLLDPLIVHVTGAPRLDELVLSVPPAARILAERFWPGPLTLVLPKRDLIPDLVTAGGTTVGIRVPDHPVALALLRSARVPVAAPSANLFGRISPTTARHVTEQLEGQVDAILDGGPCRVGVESTVVAFDAQGPALLRPGGVSLEEIQAAIGAVRVAPRAMPGQPLASPGNLPQHYAPRTPLFLRGAGADEESFPAAAAPDRVGLLALQPPAEPAVYAAVEVLSPSGDLTEAASRFFAALRRLDALDLDLIVAETFPEEGLGRALNDRLRRAAHT